jgi:hypothetical protein
LLRPIAALALMGIASVILGPSAGAVVSERRADEVREIHESLRAIGQRGLSPTVTIVEGPATTQLLESDGGESVDGGIGAGASSTPRRTAARQGAPHGEVLYKDYAESTDMLTRSTPDGGWQAIAVIHGPEAPRRVTIPLAGSEALRLESVSDGSVRVLDASGALAFTVEAPWAFDANGDPVHTSYEISGQSLVQFIDHDESSAFPIVADPTVSGGVAPFYQFYWASITFSRSEILKWAGTGYVMAAALVGRACGTIPNPAVAAGCVAVLAGISYNILPRLQEAKDRGCQSMSLRYMSEGGYPFGHQISWDYWNCVK